MADVNIVICCGRLVRDVEMHNTSGDMVISKFTIAVNRNSRKNEDRNSTDFINCVAFKDTAININKFFQKGNRILITGSWKTGNYTNKDGVKVYTNDLWVNQFFFVDSKGIAREESGDPIKSPEAFMDIPVGIEDDDMPFSPLS